MKGGLAAYGVAVRRERRVLDDDLRPGAARSVERHHQQVEVDGERVHRHHLDRQGADQAGRRLGEQLVVGEPRPVGLEVAFDAEALPSGELGEQLTGGRPRLQAERVAGEVGDLRDRRWPAGCGTGHGGRDRSSSRCRASCSSVTTCPPGGLARRHVEPHRPLDVGRKRGDVGVRQQERRQVEQIGEHAGVLGRVVEIVVAGRTSGAHPATDHPPDHQGVAVSPVRQPFVDVHQGCQQAERELHHRFVAVEVDQQGGPERPVGKVRAIARIVLGIDLGVERRSEMGSRAVEHRQVDATARQHRGEDHPRSPDGQPQRTARRRRGTRARSRSRRAMRNGVRSSHASISANRLGSPRSARSVVGARR